MRLRTLVVLAVLVLGLGAYIWFVERDLPSSEERAERARHVLALESDDVKALEIERGQERIRLVREAEEDGGWRIEEPLAARADATAVDGLVSTLANLEKERTLPDLDPAEAGLDAPRARVTLSTDEGDRTLVIGAPVPGGENMLVATAVGGPVYVVSGSVFKDLEKEPGEWRSRKMFTALRDQIDRVTLERGGRRVLLARRGETFWLEAPIVDRADKNRVGTLLGELEGLRSEEFVDDPEPSLRELGLEPPQATVEVVLRDRSEPFRLELGAAKDANRYARVGSQIFLTGARFDEALDRAPGEWRSRQWSSLAVYQIDRVGVEDAEGSLELTRVEADWQRDGETIPYSAASDFLYAVTGAEVTDVVAPDDPRLEGVDLETPTLTLTLTTRDGEEEKLTLYAPVEEGVPARSEGREVLVLLAPDAAREVTEKLQDLRAAKPEAADEAVVAEGEETAEPED